MNLKYFSQTAREERRRKNELKALSPMVDGPKSRFPTYLGVGVAALVGLGILSAKIGSGQTERNIDRLCSADSGLELVDQSQDMITFATTLLRTTPKHAELEAQLGFSIGFIYDSKFAEGYNHGIIRFAVDGKQLVPVDFKVDSSSLVITKSIPMRRIIGSDSECAGNLNGKIRDALAVASIQGGADYRHQNR